MATGKNSSASVAVPIDPRDRVLPPEPVVLTGALRHKDGGNERQFAYVPRVVRGSQGSQPVAPHSPSPQVNFSEDTQKRPWTTSQEDLETGEGERSTNGFDGKLPEKSGADEQSPRTLLQRLKPWLAPIGLLALLYMFICSLEFLSSAFRLIAGKTAGRAFSEGSLLQNPIVALMLGVLTTVLVQSSSTSTSIIVAMVSAGILDVNTCVPIIMGANIGTTITSALVSLTQAGDRERFRRAVTAATVHDSFNWLTVLVLLPIEVVTGYLRRVSGLLVQQLPLHTFKNANFDLLKMITGPLTHRIVMLDKRALEKIALGQTDDPNLRLLKVWCSPNEADVLVDAATDDTSSNVTFSSGAPEYHTHAEEVLTTSALQPPRKCAFLLNLVTLSDPLAGVLLLALALTTLISCLVLLVKLLHSVMRHSMSSIVVRTLNLKFPGRLDFLSGYVAILVGATLTALIQSSSVFTSSLTPMAGLGLITLERLYPLTLGSNIGTTVTGVLAAFAANADRLAPSLQIALCHLLFNFSGVLLFYPLPLLRRVPLRVARAIGKLSADYRWFAVVYICNMFLVVPGLCFGLSLAGPYVFYGVIGAVFLLVASLLALHFLQRTKPALLPPAMRTFGFLPLPLRSLDPADRVLKRVAQFICAPFRCLRSRFSSDSNNENCEVEADGMKHMGTSSISVATLTTVSSAVSGRSNSSLEVAGRDQRAVNSNISHL